MMACGLSKSLGFSSSLKKQQEGIVTILGGISSNTSSAPSLRRTFSADLSSKNWLSRNESFPMKRISSSEKLHASSVADEEEGSKSGFDIWAQIQEVKNQTKEIEPAQSDVWSSILSDKKKAESSGDAVPPPYVHPLVKRASSLSEKSLEICTESLGSETGCEGFASYADAEIEKEEANLVLNFTVTMEEEETEAEQESITVPNHTPCMELPRGSFPPPIRSLSSQSGSALHMKTRRDNGRLVLEAVSMPSHNNFSAKRQDGRLLLTFAEINDEPDCEIDIVSDEEDETDELQWSDEEEEEEEEVQDEFAYKPSELMFKLAPKPIGPITVHRLAHKPIGVPKTNSRWDELETKTDLSTPVVHSLPPRPRVAQLARSMKPPSTVDDTVGAACFNTCDYSWKLNNAETLGHNTKTQSYVNKSIGAGINGCKERRSLLSVEPFCIATS
ncbi:PREDICTED: protein FAF-like, chloroplastic [Brassica oleracea var. oleracea]|uniref:FAF domain-containing protein n=1 Tax=Brassica oleracea var. oleracea TaxID=109376 RepID=A0A0D3AKE4_BRAOL|nr:PREDICTED: protein FAF-like, chloroplastic [Brassica oleracea var. oleracea]